MIITDPGWKVVLRAVFEQRCLAIVKLVRDLAEPPCGQC